MPQDDLLKRYSYDIEKDLLGSGGYSDVYKAYDHTNNRDVAVKIAPFKMHSKSLDDEYNFIKHLEDHKNICNYEQVFKIESKTGKYELAVMQYYPNGTVKDLIREGVSMQGRIQIAKGIILGIDYLHKNNIIHRDLKWSNILVAKDALKNEYVPKISDFGLSKKVVSSKDCPVENSNKSGTYSYMPPENFTSYTDEFGKSSKNLIGFNYDLWSLGIMLYELFLGVLPFPIVGDMSYHDQMKNIVEKDIPSDVKMIPEPYQGVVMECLIKSPFDRSITSNKILDMVGVEQDPNIEYIEEKTQPKDPPKNPKNPKTPKTPKTSESDYDWRYLKKLVIGLLLLIVLSFAIYQVINSGTNGEVQTLVPQESTSTPSLINHDFQAFVDEFNFELEKDGKYNVYDDHKRDMAKLFSVSTKVLANNVLTDINVFVMEKVNNNEQITIEDMSLDSNGKIDYLIIK